MRDIFEDMKALIGCDYISDLRNQSNAVNRELKHLQLDEYPKRQLEDFTAYMAEGPVPAQA